MRNKKYRPWIMIIFIGAVAILALAISFFRWDKTEKIFLIVCGSILLIMDIFLVLPFYFEVKDDRIVTRIGVESLDKRYRSRLKKNVIMFDDLRDIYLEGKDRVHLTFKGGVAASIYIGIFLMKKEIEDLIYEVRVQIKGYEQQDVTNDTIK